MTAKEAIAAAGQLRPDNFTDSEKLNWIKSLEGRIFSEIVNGREGAESFPDINKITADSELFAPKPYEEIYLLYICLMSDFYRAEYNRYNNDSLLFNSLFRDFSIQYAKAHPWKKISRITG